MKTKLDLLEKYYIFQEIETVKKFLIENFFLIDFLYEVKNKIKKYFGSSTLVLKIFTDSEAHELCQSLLINIYADLSVDEAMNCLLDKFDSEYWINVSVKIRRRVIIDIGVR